MRTISRSENRPLIDRPLIDVIEKAKRIITDKKQLEELIKEYEALKR